MSWEEEEVEEGWGEWEDGRRRRGEDGGRRRGEDGGAGHLSRNRVSLSWLPASVASRFAEEDWEGR